MNNGEEGSEGDSKRVQVRFVTKLDAPFKVPPTVIAIPAALSRFGLSSVVNGLLQAADADHEPEPFDFLIDGELVRMSLQQFLLAKGISAERILKIEYARVVAPQKVEEPSFCDDRVGAVDGSSSRRRGRNIITHKLSIGQKSHLLTEMETIDIAAMQPLPEYLGLANVTPALSGTPEAVWNDANFDIIPGWTTVQLDNNQILVLGNEWIANITGNAISSRTVIKGLRLAMSLRSMVPGRAGSLLCLKDRDAIEQSVPYTELPDVNTFSDTPFTLRNQQIQPGNAIEIPQDVVVIPQPPAQQVGEESNESKVRAYTYLAAYLMRLLVKDPDNIINGLTNMKGRYESFYGPSQIVSQFSINRAQATAYRDASIGQANIMSTYTMALAHVQNTGALDERETRVLSYLGYHPFSYTGMHAYSLLMELRRDTGVSINELLTLFYADVNRAALNTISVILNNYERTTTHPNRSVYFRYAACWGAHYFASLKSRNCPYLVYTAASASKVIAATNEAADPERIAAVQKLSDVMKRTLKVAGEIIGNSLKQKKEKRRCDNPQRSITW